MQNPQNFAANVDFIIERVQAFAVEGEARDRFQANQRHHFLESASRLLRDWRAAKPCPITYRDLYEREKELTRYLDALAGDVQRVFKTYDMTGPDPDYLNPPDDPHGYFVNKDGFVTRVLPWDLTERWPEYERLPADLKQLPRLKVGDHISGRDRRDDAASPSTSKPAAPLDHLVLPVATVQVGAARGPAPLPESFVPAPASPPPLSTPTGSPPAVDVAAPLVSQLLQSWLDELAQADDGSRAAARDISPYVEFWIHILGDKPIADYTRADSLLFCEKIVDIPHPQGMQAQSPIERYEYAQEHGWTGLRRLTTTTIDNRYLTAIRRFYAWAREAGHYVGLTPTLKVMGKKVLSALPRDAFTPQEVRALFSLPKFAGQQKGNSHESGPFLVQDHIYWGYLILYLTGMRPGEIAQLRIADIRAFADILYFDLRPFDPEKGRVALADLRSLKSENASRLIPIDPLMVELGLVERAKALQALGHERLFPDWRWKTLSDGRVKHGDALARDWQKRKAGVTTRANVTAYSGRHSMASLLDELDVPQRDRERILGHSHPGVSGRYGRKGALPEKVVKAFLERDDPTLTWMRTHLVAARDRAEADRKLIETWRTRPSKRD